MAKFEEIAQKIATKTVETAGIKFKYEPLKPHVHSWAKTPSTKKNHFKESFQLHEPTADEVARPD